MLIYSEAFFTIDELVQKSTDLSSDASGILLAL